MLTTGNSCRAFGEVSGAKPYQGIDQLRNIELKAGKRIAHITFRSDGRPISEYFTTGSAIERSRLADGRIDANRLNQGLQIYGGKDADGVPRSDFKPYVQYFEVEHTIPHGQVAFGRTLANPHLNPGDYPVLPQMFINNEYHYYLKPATLEQMSNTATPSYDPGQVE